MIAMYAIKMYDIILKNLSVVFNIFSISFLDLFAIGLYNADLTTGPNPDSSSVIYAKNKISRRAVWTQYLFGRTLSRAL